MGTRNDGKWEAYQAEAEAKWGKTEAYRQYQEKSKGYSSPEWAELAAGMNQIMASFGECRARGDMADSADAQCLVRRLQEYITAHYYPCTGQILAGLGQMYVGDERFRENIDRHGAGTAAFICEAIQIYCKE